MAFIPEDAEWYLADLIEEITVEGDPRNIVMVNLTLIRADSPEEAYQKALALGQNGETMYQNPEGMQVISKFRGISQLDVIQDKLEDGAELSFHSRMGLSETEIVAMLSSKKDLAVFSPIKRMEGPDFASAEIIKEIEERLSVVRPEQRNKE